MRTFKYTYLVSATLAAVLFATLGSGDLLAQRGRGGGGGGDDQGGGRARSAQRGGGGQSMRPSGGQRGQSMPRGQSVQRSRGGQPATVQGQPRGQSRGQQAVQQPGRGRPSERIATRPDVPQQPGDRGRGGARGQRDQQAQVLPDRGRGGADRDRGEFEGDRGRGARRGDDWRDAVGFDERRRMREGVDERRRFEDGRRFDDGRRTADAIRREWRDDWDRDRDRRPFHRDWWRRFGFVGWPIYSPWRYTWWHDRPYYWWGWTPAPRLTTWLAFGWGQPYYWNYGLGGYIYYDNDYIYRGGQPYLPVNQYYNQVYQLAHSVPPISASEAERMEWAPLGVFAMTRLSDGSNERVLQIAVSKNGVISGTYFNKTTGRVHPISGMVDDESQQAAFALSNGANSPLVMETSIFNLTQSETTMLVHYGPNTAPEVWRLVRLEQPEGELLPPPVPQPRQAMQPQLYR